MIPQGLPNVGNVIMAWAKLTSVYVVCKRQQDFKTVESYIERTVRAMLQPKNQPLNIMEQGQRKWSEKTLYAEVSLLLKPDDVIIFGCQSGKRFRVIDVVDWSDYGYMEYSLRSDYTK
ncbi:MAG: hypothetical protein EBX40_04840 [Gammaproteobacteria bacterium]|nr:hypothetical protein [Gammaproteobacteria bacterium]